jgi:hypothetical protein
MGRNGAPKAVFSCSLAALRFSSDASLLDAGASHVEARLTREQEKTVKVVPITSKLL